MHNKEPTDKKLIFPNTFSTGYILYTNKSFGLLHKILKVF